MREGDVRAEGFWGPALGDTDYNIETLNWGESKWRRIMVGGEGGGGRRGSQCNSHDLLGVECRKCRERHFTFDKTNETVKCTFTTTHQLLIQNTRLKHFPLHTFINFNCDKC